LCVQGQSEDGEGAEWSSHKRGVENMVVG
jgi:hypothetical protein